MSGRPTPLTRRFLPSVVGGLVLLLAGILLLLFGGWLSAGSPAEFEFWLVLVGVIVLGAAMLAMLLGDTPAPSTTAVGSTAGESSFIEELPVVEEPESSETPAIAVPEVAGLLRVEPAPPEPAPVSRPITTSIPGAYLASLGTAPPPEPVPWDGPAPPIAAALPFVAMPRSAEGWGGPSEAASDAESALLEVELARLRARVRELESAPPAPVGPSPSFSPSRSGGSRAVPSLISAAEPPKPTLSVTGATRACVGCGTFVPTKGPDLRCGSCGRLLCTTCYWRYGSGAGLQRCPDCRRAFEESGRTAISGGRAGPALISSSPASTSLFR